jgi:hypothetical protein
VFGGVVIRPEFVSRDQVRADRSILFAYGDNMQHRGLGGQAAEIRWEPNALGIPTKWLPRMTREAFFQDADWDKIEVQRAIIVPFDRLEAELVCGGTIVIPASGIGTGRAQLPRRAPRIFGYIERRIGRLLETASKVVREWP